MRRTSSPSFRKPDAPPNEHTATRLGSQKGVQVVVRFRATTLCYLSSPSAHRAPNALTDSVDRIRSRRDAGVHSYAGKG